MPVHSAAFCLFVCNGGLTAKLFIAVLMQKINTYFIKN